MSDDLTQNLADAARVRREAAERLTGLDEAGFAALDPSTRLVLVALAGVEARLEAKIDGVEARLEAKIDAVEARLEAKIDAVEARLEAKIDAVEARLEAKIDAVDGRLSRLEAKAEERERDTRPMRDMLDRILAEVMDLKQRVGSLERGLLQLQRDAIDRHLAMDERVRDLEQRRA